MMVLRREGWDPLFFAVHGLSFLGAEAMVCQSTFLWPLSLVLAYAALPLILERALPWGPWAWTSIQYDTDGTGMITLKNQEKLGLLSLEEGFLCRIFAVLKVEDPVSWTGAWVFLSPYNLGSQQFRRLYTELASKA